jgi:hypothetical protein
MREDFRPSQVQLDYLNVDIVSHLENLGIDVENYEYEIQAIEWYNWDDKPRWFVHISKYSALGTKVGYVEVDLYGEDWNGGENPFGIELVELAGHGFPCIATTVVSIIDGDYVIEGID